MAAGAELRERHVPPRRSMLQQLVVIGFHEHMTREDIHDMAKGVRKVAEASAHERAPATGIPSCGLLPRGNHAPLAIPYLAHLHEGRHRSFEGIHDPLFAKPWY